MTIELPREIESQLDRAAQAEGISIAQYVEKLVAEASLRQAQISEFKAAITVFGHYVEADLREIRDKIANDRPDSARRTMIRFVEAFRLLAKRPDLGHVREDLTGFGSRGRTIRFWPVGSYLILP